MPRKCFALLLLLCPCAFAQIDGPGFAAGLRSKYGPPLLRETFTASPGIRMVVDYAGNGNVCRIQLPPIAPSSGDAKVLTPQAIDEFLSELIPLSMRGKELSRALVAFGAPSASLIHYENVTIAESFQGNERTSVTVTFTKEQCRDRTE